MENRSFTGVQHSEQVRIKFSICCAWGRERLPQRRGKCIEYALGMPVHYQNCVETIFDRESNISNKRKCSNTRKFEQFVHMVD
ncbi:hypothetical protein Y032_0084g1721 [Ancylostoma ceylanicum]|uniref:Uncharacterized protein n=1 Tax=Ancylostoma ceylanicum TaxID=53326 RepID=A0A016TQI3_9BILA|nr:hypothetical protein Y032_0084g1721 [Ancylostoma ceylanicum]